jgi:hypothetical protein
MPTSHTWLPAAAVLLVLTGHADAALADQICEARVTECRTGLIKFISHETIGLDIGME